MVNLMGKGDTGLDAIGIPVTKAMGMGGSNVGIGCIEELGMTNLEIRYGMGVMSISDLGMMIGILGHVGMTSICNPGMLGKIDMGIFVSMGDMHTMVMTSRGGMKTMDMGGIGTRLMGSWGMMLMV